MKTNSTTIEIFTAKKIHNLNSINMYNRRKITVYYADKFADLPDDDGFMLLELYKENGWYAWTWDTGYRWQGGYDVDNSWAEEDDRATETRYEYDLKYHWIVAVKEEEFEKITEED